MTYDGVLYHVVWVSLEEEELRIVRSDAEGKPLRTLEGAQKRLGGRARAITNAGIFESGEKPTGLLIEDGVERAPRNRDSGEGNFYLLPNGIFYVDETGAHIVESGRYGETAGAHVRLATQSGPLLLDAGAIHPRIHPASPNRLVRSGVGVDGNGRVALVLSAQPVTFYDFALLFRHLGCPDALYLDGVVSRLYFPAAGLTSLKEGPFAAMLAVVPREKTDGGVKSGR